MKILTRIRPRRKAPTLTHAAARRPWRPVFTQGDRLAVLLLAEIASGEPNPRVCAALVRELRQIGGYH